jgi:uncharacterized protein YukJ
MPLDNYGILKGRPVQRRLARVANAHYQVHVVDKDTDYRIAVNVRSKLSPSELEYLVAENFQHPITKDLLELPLGFNYIKSKPGGLALDFIRLNLFDPDEMVPLPFEVPGPDNDLNEKIDRYIQKALSDEEALIYAFGERWGPERGEKDKIFGFQPGNGIHDIHMNQGNAEQFRDDDGVYQDGALLIHFPREQRWVGIFLKFQSQCWHTDDETGHRLEAPEQKPPEDEEGKKREEERLVRIVAALANPAGPAPEKETVTLLNISPEPIDLSGWAIADRNKNKHRLSGTIDAGATFVVTLPQDVYLSNDGGTITLLDDGGRKVDGVSYTEGQTRRQGWTVVF